MLESAGEALDVREFGRLTAAARAAAGADRPADALRSYDQALALWRGDALADVALEGQALIAATRLDQERRLVGEERIDCALALGQHLQLIPELEHRVEEAPLRERSRAQLMLALYRAGRQTEALDRYREGRALLVEQAGVEPGRDLHELERAILTHDPALELAPPVRDDARPTGPLRDGGAEDLLSLSRAGAGRERRWLRACCSRLWSRLSCSWSAAPVPPTHSHRSTPTRRGRSIPAATGSWTRCASGPGPGGSPLASGRSGS